MKRTVSIAILVLAFTFTMIGTATASIFVVSADSKGELSADKQSVVVTGSIICSDGNTASVSVILAQSSGKVSTTGVGDSGDFTCTGQPQAWVAIVTPVSGGTQFKHGPATLIFGAFDSTDNSSSETHTQRYKL